MQVQDADNDGQMDVVVEIAPGVNEVVSVGSIFGIQPIQPGGKRSVRYVLFDHLGSAKMLINDQCEVVWPEYGIREVNKLLPFGQERSVRLNSSEIAYNLNFTNKELDRDLELNYFGARYYHPELPRFISPDPVGGKPAIPMSWNKYLYCRNDPMNFFDPSGETIESALALIKENRSIIHNTAKLFGGRVTPELLGRIVFQENRNDKNLVKNNDKSSFLGFGGAEGKNALGMLSVSLFNTNHSFGIVEMKTFTAGNLLVGNGSKMPHETNCAIMKALQDPATALVFAAKEIQRLAEISKANGENVSDDILLSRYNSGITDGGLTEVGERSSIWLSEIMTALYGAETSEEDVE